MACKAPAACLVGLVKASFLAVIALASSGLSGALLADEAADLAAIRALYAKIDAAESAKTETITFALKDDPLEGTITRRSYEGGFSAIQVSYTAGDHGGSDQSFYFKGEDLFFIFTEDSSWQFAEGSTDEKPKTMDTLTQSRYYVKGGKIIQVLQRSATTNAGKELDELIAKVENKKVQDDKKGPALLKRAAALLKIKTKEQALKYFSTEGL